jgi:hypothetical protein
MVVLPDPEEPKMTRLPPFSTVKEMPRKIALSKIE